MIIDWDHWQSSLCVYQSVSAGGSETETEVEEQVISAEGEAEAEADAQTEQEALSTEENTAEDTNTQPENEVSEVEIPNVGKILVRSDADGYNEEVNVQHIPL